MCCERSLVVLCLVTRTLCWPGPVFIQLSVTSSVTRCVVFSVRGSSLWSVGFQQQHQVSPKTHSAAAKSAQTGDSLVAFPFRSIHSAHTHAQSEGTPWSEWFKLVERQKLLRKNLTSTTHEAEVTSGVQKTSCPALWNHAEFFCLCAFSVQTCVHVQVLNDAFFRETSHETSNFNKTCVATATRPKLGYIHRVKLWLWKSWDVGPECVQNCCWPKCCSDVTT